MKQFFTFVACVFAALFGSSTAEAGTVSLQIMQPEAVKLSIMSWENPMGEVLTSTMGVNTIQFDESQGAQLVIEGVAPYQLTSVNALGSYESPMVTMNRAALFLTSEINGRYYTVNVINLDESRTSSVTVNVLDDTFVPSLLKVRRGDNEVEITENPQVLPFNPETESRFILQRIDYLTICNVKKNGEDVPMSFSMYSFDVVDGDVLDVTVAYPDVDLPVVINYPEGLKDVVRSVTVDSDIAEDWDSADFKVHSGRNVQINLDNFNYKLLGVEINGVTQESIFNNVSFIPGLEPVTVDIRAREFGNCKVTLNIDHPESIQIFPGHYAGTEPPFELTGTTTVIEVPETNPYICMTLDLKYILTSITDGKGNNIEFLNIQSKSIRVEDGMTINITTTEKAFDSSFVIYLDTEENVTTRQYICRSDMIYIPINAGYNVVPFIGAEQGQYLVQFYANTNGTFYVNDEKQELYNPMSIYWQGIPDDGMVLKVYFGGEPTEHQVTLDIDDEIAEHVSVVRDMITPVNDFSALFVHKGSHIGLSMAEGVYAKVSVDGEEVSPDDKGMHNIFVAGDHQISVKASEVPSGIEEIEGSEANGAVYNLQGIRVSSNANASSLNNLPAGIYIFNGKKVTVK